MMAGKRVSFPPSGTKSHRSRDSVRDSGFGSLSSEYGSIGGRPDRMFTAQDYDQRHNVGALQEALERATKNAEYYKGQYHEKDRELAKAHKTNRDFEARWKAECGFEARWKAQRAHNEQLEQDLKASREQYAELQADYDVLQDNYTDLRKQCAIDPEPMNNPMAALPIRTKSKREHDDKRMKDRMKTRINPKDEPGSKSSSHRSSRDRSRPASTRQGAYIEEVLPPRNHGNNYMTSSESHRLSMMQQPAYSTIPRTSQPTSSVIYHPSSEFPDGDYHSYPLPAEPRGRRK